jgi:hypothetical protein
MLTATLGLVGVLVGAFVSQRLSASWQRRRERLEALVALVATSARVVGAHERLYELIAHGASDVASEQVQQALAERGEAHAEWRTANARAAILMPDNEPLHAAMSGFGRARASATRWVQQYQRLGASSFADYEESERASWRAMHNSRDHLIAASQAIVLDDDASLPTPWKRRRRRSYEELVSLAATLDGGSRPPAGD